MNRSSARRCRAVVPALVLAGQLAALLHPGATPPAQAAKPVTASAWLAELDSTSAKRLALIEARDLALADDTKRKRRSWLLWATSAVAVGAVVAVFAQRQDVERAPERPDLPDFPDAP